MTYRIFRRLFVRAAVPWIDEQYRRIFVAQPREIGPAKPIEGEWIL